MMEIPRKRMSETDSSRGRRKTVSKTENEKATKARFVA